MNPAAGPGAASWQQIVSQMGACSGPPVAHIR